MNLVRVNPLRELQALQDRVNRTFFGDDFFSRFFEGSGRQARLQDWSPSVDICEKENELIFTVELPGFTKDQIQISAEEGYLNLSGERKFESKDENYHRIERVYGAFSRSFELPRSVNAEKITAKLKDGLLTLTLPKREEAKTRRIPVKVN
ncbi:MAG: Hsp20/alpha crystallin family protein [Acidobacteriota bacterium]